MKLIVDFYWQNDEIASMEYDGSKLSWAYPVEDHMQECISNPLHIGGKLIDPKQDPEKFIKMLHVAYSGSYFRASKALDVSER
jgi:hypothetical protein